MPWKGEKEPYKIWLSEIILQQTRVEQGLAYYNKFLINYPNIFKLANAKDEAVYKLWEGLGYYNRCKNLLATARIIAFEKKGIFPQSYEEIMQLKGVGNYTAAAISSFAFNLPHAVVDGNVVRVLARVFNIDTPVDTTEGKNQFNSLAQELLNKKNPGLYNQAIMDFGATICKPLLPLCNTCPLQNICKAYKNKTVNALPVKKKKLQIKNRWFTYIILSVNNEFLVHQRTAKDIWFNLFEFYLVETNSKPVWTEQLLKTIAKEQFNINAAEIRLTNWLTQKLTHQTIHATFITLVLKEKMCAPENYVWVNKKQLEELAFPKIINDYLHAETLQHSLF